jgi:hypothetical protein
MALRPYFVLGDIFTNLVAGMAAALCARALVGISWNILLAMPAGMVAGMLASSLAALLFMPLFGAFEVMLPAMLTGMISGMLVGMLESMRGLSPAEAAACGSASGIVSIAWAYAVTAWVRRRDRAGPRERA